MNLKEKLRGALLEEKENKNSLVIESKILDGHFGTLKNCSNMNSLIETTIHKVNTFQNKNFSNKLINESLFNMLQGLFGDFDSEFFGTVKSRLADWISDKMEFDGWVRNAVKVEIENVSDEDVPKLFSDCRFLTDKVSKGMIQGFGDNILATGIDTELGSKTGQVFKSSVQTIMGDDNFHRDLQDKMMGEICSELKKVSDKMDAKAEEIRNSI